MAKSYAEIKESVKKYGVSGTSNGYNGSDTYKKIKEKVASSGLSFDGVDENYIDTFSKDVSNYLSSAQSDYEKIGYNNASSSYDSRFSTWSELNSRASKIRAYINSNKGKISEEAYNNMTSFLDDFNTGSESLLKAFDEAKRYYSQWETEKDYNDYIQYGQRYNELKTFDLEAGKTEIDEMDAFYKQIAKARNSAGQLPSIHEQNQAGYVSPYDSYMAMVDEMEKKYGTRDVDELNTFIREKNNYYKEAERVQTGVKLHDNAINAEDFDEYTLKGLNIENPSYIDAVGKVEVFGHHFGGDQIKNKVTFMQDENNYQSIIMGDDSELANPNLHFMEAEEVAVYNYYLGKGDIESAELYLKSLNDTLNKRQAGELAENIEKANLEWVMAINAGLDQWATGAKNLSKMITGDESYTDPTVMQYASSIVRENIESDFWRGAYDLGVTLSNQLPSILVGSLTGQIGGLATMGVSVAGNAYTEMINLGYNKNQARSYATLVTAAELGLQSVLGGYKALGGTLSNGVTEFFASKVDNALAKLAIRGLGNMAGEGLEEAIQSVLEPTFKSMISGENYDVDWDEVIYSGILGALSAGVLEGVPSVVGYGVDAAVNAVDNYQTGKSFKKAGGDINRVATYIKENGGTKFSADSVAYKLAGKVNEKTGTYKIGKLLNEANATLTEMNKSDIMMSLARKGINGKSAENYVNALAAVVERGYNLTKEQISALDADPAVKEAIEDAIINPNSTVNQRMQGYREAINMVKNGVNPKAETAQNSTKAEQTEIPTGEAQTVKESEFSWSEDGKTIYDNEDVSVKEISSIKDGAVYVRLEDGREVNAKDVSFSSQDEALMYEMVANLGVSAETAMSMIDIFKKGNGAVSAKDFRNDAPLAYKYGTIEYATGLGKLGLTYDQKVDLFALGRKDAQTEAKSMSKASKDGGVKTNSKSPKFKGEKVEKNGIIYEGTNPDDSGMSEVQKASIIGAEILAKSSSLEIHVYESYKDSNDNIVVDIDGKTIPAPNGMFRDGNKIYLDINAGNNQQGTMLYTMSHEVGHYIRQWNAEEFKALGDFLFEHYEGKDVDKLIEKEIKNRKKHYEAEDKAIPSEMKLYDEAYEEVVCNSLSKMFADENAYIKLAELKKQNQTLWEKLGEAIKNLLDKLKKAIGIYSQKEFAPDTTALATGLDMEAFNQLQDLYIKAFVKADENYQAASKNKTVSNESSTTEEQFSDREVTPISDTDYKDIEKHFGTTNSYEVAGYMLKNGKMLDFSGKHWGDDYSTSRQVDHRDIQEVLDGRWDDGVDAMIDMISNGNIRLMPEMGGINLAVMPNASQINQLRGYINHFRGEIVIDIDAVGGDTIHSWEYNKGTSSSKILSDIKAYFEKGTIPQQQSNLNQFLYSDRDSDGNKLSKEQQEFFKDSKVRDEKGKLLVMYHGTPNATFTKFRDGSYFTEHKWYAERYKGQSASSLSYKKTADNPDVYTVYLNIKKPFDTRNEEERRIFEEEYFRHYGMGTPLMESGLPDWLDAIDLQEFLEEMGYDYDGLILDEGSVGGYGEEVVNRGLSYVVFDPSQVKNVDNKAPTTDPDIRYSLREIVGESGTNYGKGVYLDSQLLSNLTDTERIQMVKEYVKDLGGSVFTAFDDNGNAVDVHIAESSKKFRNNSGKRVSVNNDLTKKHINNKVKQESIALIDELILTSKYDSQKPALYQHGWVDDYGKNDWEYWVTYIQDKENTIWEATLNIATTTNGDKILYDINPIKMMERSVESDTISIDGSVTHPKDFVKSFSENSGNKFSDRDPELAAQREKVNKVLESENAKLKEDNQYLKELVKLQRKVTHGTKFTKSSVQIVASRLMKYASAKGNRAELVNLLNEFYEYIAAGNDLTWESVAEKAQPAIDWLKNNVSRTEKLDAYSREVLNTIRSKRIYLDEQQQAEAAYIYGSFYEYRKRAMGSLTIVNKGNPQGAISLDSQWQEFATMYPELFDADTNSNEMPMKLLEIVSDLRDFKHSNEYEYADDMVEQDLLAKVYDSYWDVSTLHTVADSMQKDITKLKIEHRKKMTEVREYHNDKHSQLKQDYQEKIARIREDYRERNAKTTRELMTRYQESRAKAIEGRHKTEYRKKIKKVVGDLNQLLLRPTKDKHIKEELRQAVAEALSAINMDTIGAEERVAKYNELIAKTSDLDMIAELTQTRDRIELQGENLKDKLTALQTAYEKIKKSTDTDLVNAYQEPVMNAIKNVVDMVGNTSIRDMSISQLEAVYEMYSMILHTVRTANKAFKAQKGETITQISEAVNDEIRKNGKEKFSRNPIAAYLKKTGWTLLKPFTAFRTMGSDTFTGLYKNLRNGEDVFYSDINEAKSFIQEKYKKYNFKSWNQKQTKTFTAKSGKTFTLNLEQMLSLYAYSRRQQAHDHIIEGGIVLEDAVIEEKKLGIPIKYKVDTKSAFNISEETLQEICDSLTEEQRAFVEDMQTYLSDVMGAKGNEVSMELLGVKLFKEKFYFPLKSSKYYMGFKPEEAGEIKLKNSSFSKETVQHANNPVVLQNFTDVWATHINDMSMYHAFVLPLEDFTRVYNYKTKTAENVETVSTEATIANAYGEGATQYIRNFLKSLNGGVRIDGVGLADKAISLAKKGAVLASASVAIQQPSAIMRAMALINPIHFVASTHKSINLVKHNRDWAELKTYAPIAGIKEMGGYDIGIGKGTVDWIKDQSAFRDKVDDALGKAPAFMDEITWVSIWNAVKRETASLNKGMDINSEAFLKKAGERFTEVVSLTQVYDSVFSRSDIMRNANPLAKMLTAFMAEPTTALNMLWDSGVQGKRTGRVGGFVKATASTSGAVFAAIVFNATLKSIITAMRDDDEDESYAEKYIGAFVGNVKDDLNILTYIPFVKDIVSIFKGYDVERMDMALFSDLKNAIDAFDSDSKTEYEKWTGFIGAISAFAGIPYKNVERDIRGAYNTIKSFMYGEKTTDAGIDIAIREGWTGEEISNKQQLYEAIINGDQAQFERVKARYKDADKLKSAIRSALKEHYLAGDLDSDTAQQYLVEYADMDENDAYWKVQEWEYELENGDSEDYTKYNDFFAAVETGKNIKTVIKDYTDNGVSTQTLAAQITSHFKPLYKEMSTRERASIKGYLLNAYALLGYDRAKKSKDIDKWLED